MKNYLVFLAVIPFFVGDSSVNLTQAQSKQNQPLLPVGSGVIATSRPEQNCITPEMVAEIQKTLDSLPRENHRLANTNYPLLAWPFDHALHDGLILGNYVDDDPTDAIKDYMGNPHSYDGHRGTDIGLYSFRDMDRGVRVIAAAAGEVIATEFSQYDRNTRPPYPGDCNFVTVRHADGTFALYCHFRKNAVTVEVGETVQAGQVLGLTGSSGNSTDAHLHLELFERLGIINRIRDPWHGTFNPLPSLWKEQEPYVGTAPLRIYDMGVFTQAAAGGNLNVFPIEVFKEKPTQPKVMGANEPFVAIWILLQGQEGDPYTLEILRPDNSVYSFVDFSLPFKFQGGWNYWVWSFAGAVSSADYGIWTARVLINGSNVKQVEFEVGAATVYPPRFWPIAGRSFRIDGNVQKDTLRVSSLGGPVTYSLSNAPDFVTLADSIVTVAAVSSQPNRSLYFEAVATDAVGLTDTMWYHIVDPSKPLDAPTSVEEASGKPAPGSFSLSQNYPNPFNPSTTIEFALPQRSDVTLKLYDILGREVATLLEGELAAGVHQVDFNAEELASGVYIYRIEAEGSSRFVRARKLMLLK
ncbi:MAG: peptidoglycan DD-metalloendopeptidase family protein [bacterium]